MASNSSGRNRDLWVVFAVALAVRLAFLSEHAAGPAFSIPLYDERAYRELALALLAGQDPGEALHWQPIFYPRFLAIFYELFGTSFLAVHLFQALLDATSSSLTALLGRRVFGAKTGLVAGLIAAFYGPAVLATAELLATSWALFFTVVLLLLFERLSTGAKLSVWLVTGVASGLAVLTRPLFLPFIVLGLGILGYYKHKDSRWGLLIAALGLCLVLGPASAERAAATGSHGVLPISGSLNLFLGNNADRCAALNTRGFAWERLVRMPFATSTKPSDEWNDTEGARYFLAKTLDYAARDPVGAAKGVALKALQILHGPEIPRNGDPYLGRHWSLVLSALLSRIGTFGFPFAFLLPFAIFGAVHERKRIPWFLWLFVGTYAAATVLVFVAGRYRTPLLPILAIFAAAGGISAWTTLRDRAAWRALRAPAGAALLGCGVSLLPTADCEFLFDYEAEFYQMGGSYLLEQGDTARGERFLTEAVRLKPRYAEAHQALGLLSAARGETEAALAHFEVTLETYPDHGPTLRSSGLVLLRRGDAREALRRLVAATRQRAVTTDELAAIGHQLLREGRASDAQLFLDSAKDLARGRPAPSGSKP